MTTSGMEHDAVRLQYSEWGSDPATACRAIVVRSSSRFAISSKGGACGTRQPSHFRQLPVRTKALPSNACSTPEARPLRLPLHVDQGILAQSGRALVWTHHRQDDPPKHVPLSRRTGARCFRLASQAGMTNPRRASGSLLLTSFSTRCSGANSNRKLSRDRRLGRSYRSVRACNRSFCFTSRILRCSSSVRCAAS